MLGKTATQHTFFPLTLSTSPSSSKTRGVPSGQQEEAFPGEGPQAKLIALSPDHCHLHHLHHVSRYLPVKNPSNSLLILPPFPSPTTHRGQGLLHSRDGNLSPEPATL